jgi:hypothetical protein
MITVTEKDGATIIVIENPTGSEQRVIEQARNAVNIGNSAAWGKFKKGSSKPAPVQPEQINADLPFSLDDFEEIIGDSDLPF